MSKRSIEGVWRVDDLLASMPRVPSQWRLTVTSEGDRRLILDFPARGLNAGFKILAGLLLLGVLGSLGVLSVSAFRYFTGIMAWGDFAPVLASVGIMGFLLPAAGLGILVSHRLGHTAITLEGNRIHYSDSVPLSKRNQVWHADRLAQIELKWIAPTFPVAKPPKPNGLILHTRDGNRERLELWGVAGNEQQWLCDAIAQWLAHYVENPRVDNPLDHVRFT